MRNIQDILAVLGEEGIPSVMVEGGAGVITSFLQAQVVDLVVLTLTARLVGGLRGVESRLAEDGPRLDSFGVERFDEDLLVWGIPRWASGVT